MIQEIHQKALLAAEVYRRSESDLLSILQEVDKNKVYLHYECRSLFDYCTRVLRLSESVSYNFVTVARKSKEIPALKEAIEEGSLSVSKARKITPILTQENQEVWILKAQTLPQSKLEREVAKCFPEKVKTDRMRPVQDSFYEHTVTFDEETQDLLKRVKDLEAQRTRKAPNTKEAMKAAFRAYLEKHDPIEKAKRSKIRFERKDLVEKMISKKVLESMQSVTKPVVTKSSALSDTSALRNREVKPHPRVATQTSLPLTTTIPASVTHQVNLRDGWRCGHINSKGERCNERRWLHRHHIIPKTHGGLDTFDNLKLLCSAHHRMIHLEISH